jgi:hypothetical protein
MRAGEREGKYLLVVWQGLVISNILTGELSNVEEAAREKLIPCTENVQTKNADIFSFSFLFSPSSLSSFDIADSSWNTAARIQAL